MRLPVVRLLLSVCALLAVVPAAANAATTPPKVTSVAPLKLKIGDRLTIRGKGFLAGKNRNTVLFKATGSRAVFVKAETATATKIVVKVPAKLLAVLKVKSGQSVATKFQLRVLARRLSAAYTPADGSPTIAPAPVVPAASSATTAAAATAAAEAAAAAAVTAVAAPAPDCDSDGTPDATDTDDDNDLLSDTTEATIGTDRCNADSDGDGMEDGWEYQSAKDLNRESCPAAEYPTACPGVKPYPVRKPYQNPLFADASSDYDGDYLSALWEYTAWKKHGVRSLTNMWYSDGLQSSQDSSSSDGCVGLVEDPVTGHVDKYPTGQLASPSQSDSGFTAAATQRWAWLYGKSAYTLDTQSSGPGHGCLSDDERDEDGDFLSNAQELNTMMSGASYVQTLFEEPAFKTLWDGTDPMDSDTDGDGIVDGMDDQDHDDFWNVEEIKRGTKSAPDGADSGSRTGLWVDPYNPCLPARWSRTCPVALLLGGTAWRPFLTPGAQADFDRWPLYNTALYSSVAFGEELWSGVVAGQQKLPLQQPGDPDVTGAEHPLLPRPS